MTVRIGLGMAAMFTLLGCDTAQDAAQNAQGDLTDYVISSGAKDQIEVYEIAKKNGDNMQTCTQAMVIAQMFLQAKDEDSWKDWKAKEKEDCKAAGLPTK